MMNAGVIKYLGSSAAIIVFAGIVIAMVRTYETKLTPIRYVRTEGVFEHLKKSEVKQAIKPLVNDGFFSTDLQTIKNAVMSLPWVYRASVKRVWPDALDIKVYEQAAFVRWGNTGLLNERGELFNPKDLKEFQHLPLISGPEGQEKKVLEIMKGLNTTLSDQAMELSEFKINNRRAWKMVLANGIEILLGRTDQLKNFQRFLKSVVLFKPEHIDRIATVDLRYPNGFAVSWKHGSDEINWQKLAKEYRKS